MNGNRRVLTKPRALALCLVWFWSICAVPPLATAQAALHVVFLDSGNHPRAERVRVELEASGFSAQVIRATKEGDLSLQLAGATLRESARLGLAVRSASGHSELLVYDAESGTIETHPVTQGSDSNEAIFSIRVVELLRASQLPSAAEAPPVSSEAAAAPRAAGQDREPGAAPARAYAALELGIAVFGSPGGLGPGMAFALSASAFVARSLRLGVYALLPLSTMKHEALEGSSATRVTLVGLELGGEFFRDSPLRTSLDGGFTVAILATEGHSSLSYLDDVNTRRASFGAHLRGAVAYHFTQLLALRSALTVGAQLSQFSLQYAGRSAAHWGLPWLSAQLLFELRL